VSRASRSCPVVRCVRRASRPPRVARRVGGGWATYRDALKRVIPGSSTDAVAFANFIPWGSSLTKQFLGPLRAEHPRLLDDVLAFADRLNVAIVQALRPRLLILPRSLADSPVLASTPLGRAERTRREVKLSRSAFRFVIGTLERGDDAYPAAFLPHPSSLRTDRERVANAMSEQLGRLLVPAA
jgi:hypothetical protein